jgi:hypothetical protein
VPLRPPPLDEHGNVIPHDHEGVLAADGVIRRISELQLVKDGQGAKRVSSMAFKPSSEPNAGMSVDLEASIVEAGLDPKAYVTTPRWMGSIRFEAGKLRAEGFCVGYDPLPDNPHHGEVWGAFSTGQQKKLKAMAEWFVKIDGVSL